MKRFKIPVWEEVHIWQSTEIEIEAESLEDVITALKEDTLLDKYDILKESSGEMSYDTMTTLGYSTEHTDINEIEEL